MAIALLLAVVGLGYGAFFLDDFPARMSLFASQFVIKLVCSLGIGCVICLLGFSVIWFVYRKNLNRRREECRCRVMQLLDLHFGDSLRTRRNVERKDVGTGPDQQEASPDR